MLFLLMEKTCSHCEENILQNELLKNILQVAAMQWLPGLNLLPSKLAIIIQKIMMKFLKNFWNKIKYETL